jgi:hypothetical protein
MQLSCRKCSALLLAIPLACHEQPTTPPPYSPPYVLQTVGNQPLPAVLYAAPGDTTTVLLGTISLSDDGTAAYTERIRSVRSGTPTTTADYKLTYRYEIIGDSVAFSYQTPCPPNALCVAPPGGRISGLNLTLSFGNPPWRPPFQYFRWLPD